MRIRQRHVRKDERLVYCRICGLQRRMSRYDVLIYLNIALSLLLQTSSRREPTNVMSENNVCSSILTLREVAWYCYTMCISLCKPPCRAKIPWCTLPGTSILTSAMEASEDRINYFVYKLAHMGNIIQKILDAAGRRLQRPTGVR